MDDPTVLPLAPKSRVSVYDPGAAGGAEKDLLNTISTLSMVGLGRTGTTILWWILC